MTHAPSSALLPRLCRSSGAARRAEYDGYYASLLCPWDVGLCGDEALGMHGHEWLGVPAEWGYDTSAPYGVEAPQRAAMSCGLCGQLAQAIGPPPYVPPEAAAKAAATAANDDDAEVAAAEVDAWDLRPFGVWLATHVLPTQGLARTLGTLNKYRAAGGDVVLGFLRQGLRLQAQASGTMEGRRKRADALSSVAAQEWAQSVCRRMWPMSLQASYDCAVAAGHGHFHYHLDPAAAHLACWFDNTVKTRPIRPTNRGFLKAADWPRMAEAWGRPGPESVTAGAAWRRIRPKTERRLGFNIGRTTRWSTRQAPSRRSSCSCGGGGARPASPTPRRARSPTRRSRSSAPPRAASSSPATAPSRSFCASSRQPGTHRTTPTLAAAR